MLTVTDFTYASTTNNTKFNQKKKQITKLEVAHLVHRISTVEHIQAGEGRVVMWLSE